MHAEGRQAWYNVTTQREKAFKICTLSSGVEAWVGLYFVKGQQGGKASLKEVSERSHGGTPPHQSRANCEPGSARSR